MGLEPAHLAVRTDDPVDDVVLGALLDGPRDGREDALAILGVHVVLVGLEGAREASRVEPVDLLQHRRPDDSLRGDVPIPRAQPPRLERDAKLLLRVRELLEQVRVVERGRGAIGDLLQEADVGLLERLSRVPADRHHAEDGAARAERHDHHRAHREPCGVVAERRARVHAEEPRHVDRGHEKARPALEDAGGVAQGRRHGAPLEGAAENLSLHRIAMMEPAELERRDRRRRGHGWRCSRPASRRRRARARRGCASAMPARRSAGTRRSTHPPTGPLLSRSRSASRCRARRLARSTSCARIRPSATRKERSLSGSSRSSSNQSTRPPTRCAPDVDPRERAEPARAPGTRVDRVLWTARLLAARDARPRSTASRARRCRRARPASRRREPSHSRRRSRPFRGGARRRPPRVATNPWKCGRRAQRAPTGALRRARDSSRPAHRLARPTWRHEVTTARRTKQSLRLAVGEAARHSSRESSGFACVEIANRVADDVYAGCLAVGRRDEQEHLALRDASSVSRTRDGSTTWHGSTAIPIPAIADCMTVVMVVPRMTTRAPPSRAASHTPPGERAVASTNPTTSCPSNESMDGHGRLSRYCGDA